MAACIAYAGDVVMRHASCAMRGAQCVMRLSDMCCTVLMWVMGDTMRVGMGVMYLLM